MILPVALFVMLAVFLSQLLLCFFSPVRRWKRYFTAALGAADGLGWLLFLLSMAVPALAWSGFAAFLLGLLGLAALAADGAAWGIYRFVKWIQNLIK